MALPTASDNIFPKLIGSEGAAPGTPAASTAILYVKSDGLWYSKDDAGAEKLVSGGSGLADQGTYTYLDATEAAAPGTPASGKVRLYAKADGLLYSKDDAGAETAVSGGGGGSDLVQVASGYGNVRIPGLAGSPDKMPASPHASDDEFDATSTLTTVLGASLDQNNTSDFPSFLHLARATCGSGECAGAYKASPSMPFTVTAECHPTFDGAYTTNGLFVGEASPGKLLGVEITWDASGNRYIWRRLWTNYTTIASEANSTAAASLALPVLYLRLIVASSTDITLKYSLDGLMFKTVVANYNPGFTVGSVGLLIGRSNNAEAAFGWVRFA